jgi:quercetin dioxygenase-like cupin family protein
MRKGFGYLMLAAAISIVGVSTAALAAGLEKMKSTPILTNDALKWQDVVSGDFPKGMKAAVLASSGDYSVTRVIVPPHAVIRPHSHPAAEAVTVVGGEVGFRFGKDQDMTGKLYGPGAFFVMAGGDWHYLWTGDQEGVFDVQSDGPAGITFIPKN